MNNYTIIEQDNGITAVYEIDRRGDWHLIARSDVPA